MRTFAFAALLLTSATSFAQTQPQALNNGVCSTHPTYLNRIRLLGGIGPDGMTLDDHNTGAVRVEPWYGPVVGLGYERVVSSRVSLSVEALTGASAGSKTYIAIGGIGFDF